MKQPTKNAKTEKQQKKPKKQKNDKNFEVEDYGEPKKWYEGLDIKEALNAVSVTEQVLIEVKEEAKKCNDQEVANNNIKRQKTNSNYQWMKTMMSSGTVSDKIAAHTLTIQDNPICSLETLRNLVSMVKVGKKKECFTVMETLTELFLGTLLKPKEVLQSFHEKPLSVLNDLSSGNALTRRKILSAWYFEDQLKEIFTTFVLALNKAAQDTVEKNKEKAITAMFQLLSGVVEQEKNLLAYIVNKLGDPSQKVASKAIYCLTQLLLCHSNKHSNKQEMVLKEIEKLLFRPNVGTRAQYYGLCFLSQFYLSHDYPDIAKKLIELYLAFFKACIKKGDVDSRMMSAILMGINRAYPYAKMEYESMQEHVDTLYKLVHLANFNVAIQVLTLLHHVTLEKMADRFYGALYRKLSDPKLLTTTHQAMLLSLIYKSLKKDTQVNRIRMFIKRLLQVSLYVQPSFACGILYTVSQLIGKKGELNALIVKQSSVNLDKFNEDGDEDEKYYDIKDEKDELEIKLEKEEQELNLNVENGVKKKSKTKEGTIDHTANGLGSTTIEIKEEDDEEKPDVKSIEIKPTGPSWVHRSISQNQRGYRPITKYNPLARNPLYGGGEFCGYTELQDLKSHFHPTVALYATNILNGRIIKYSGDPLKDFTLIRFLERFVFKNPKKVKEEKAGAHPTLGIRKFYKPKGVKLLPVRSKNYLNASEKSIPVEEQFLYSYLQRRYQAQKIKEKEDDSDLESVQSEEFEEMLDKMAGLDNGEEKEDIDFMNEIGDKLKKKEKDGKKKGKHDEDVNSDDEDNLDELDDEDDFGDDEDVEGDEDFENDDDFQEDDLDLTDDDDNEAIDFDSDEEDSALSPKKQKKKLRKTKNKDDITSLFASADEFASLLEEEGSSGQKVGSGNVFENKDKASQKQLAWEEKRNQWLRGFNKNVEGKGGGKGGKFGKKRPNNAKFNNHRSKKFKK